MRHAHQPKHQSSVHQKTKTHIVTNTQLMIAVAAAFLAGGLAFVSSPNRQADENSCSVVSMEYGERCRGSRYKGTSFVCSDGTTGMLSDELCRTTSKIQRMIEEACASRQCRVAPPVVVDEPRQEPVASPVVPEPAAAAPQAIGCELSDVRFFNRCGRNQYQGVEVTCSNGTVASPEVNCQGIANLQEYANTYCGQIACNPPAQNQQNPGDTNTNPRVDQDTTNSDPSTLPVEPNNPFNSQVQNVPVAGAPVVSSVELVGPLFLEKNDQKITVRVKMQNTGNVSISPESKYTLSFLDENNGTLVSYVFNFENELGVGALNYFSSNVTLPLNARMVQVMLDSDISNGENRSLRSLIPTSFFNISN